MYPSICYYHYSMLYTVHTILRFIRDTRSYNISSAGHTQTGTIRINNCHEVGFSVGKNSCARARAPLHVLWVYCTRPRSRLSRKMSRRNLRFLSARCLSVSLSFTDKYNNIISTRRCKI